MKFLAVFSFLLFCGYSTGKLYSVKDCGKSLAAVGRIVNGVVTQPGEYPWMASIYERYNGVWGDICGGSILNENWVLTAAHCFNTSLGIEDYAVFLGLYSTKKVNDPLVQKRKVSKIIIHDEYDDDGYEHDIALVKTATPIDINIKKHVNAICLPTDDTNPTGEGTALGWGSLSLNGSYPDELRAVTLPLVDLPTCKQIYGRIRFPVVPEMICAGGNGKDTCEGDSGGPFFQVDKKGVATLIGTVANGAGCAYKNYPGIFMKVSAYKSWIAKNMD